MSEQPIVSSSVDALVPAEMARKAEAIGVAKIRLEPYRVFALAVLAGAFIAMGAVFAITVTAGAAGALPYGVSRLLAGLVFSLGLILVVGAGAELFTGNNLIVMAWADRKVSMGRMLGNWALVYAGNFVGAVATAYGMFLSGQYAFGGGAVGATALAVAGAKLSYGWVQAFVLGAFANALVCLAVWLCLGARSATDKILAILFPVSAFVAAGFEHSVANMYFVPVALFIKSGASEAFWAAAGLDPTAYAGLTWGAFLARNLVPVTLGNIAGGAGMVGLVYWFVYLRPSWTTRR